MIHTDRPVLLLDTKRCKSNIQYMAEKIHRLGIDYRPHFKTHQSAEIGSWYRDFGVTGITVSSSDMAAYFQKNGWNDITIAFPATKRALSKIDNLSKSAGSLRVILNDPFTAQYFTDNISSNLEVYIEIDAGYGRTGIAAEKTDSIAKIISLIDKSEFMTFYGFYVHDGRTYHVKGQKRVREVMDEVFDKLNTLKEQFREARLCIGDTPSCSLLSSFPGIDELSPGNNVFFDLMQVEIGSCRPEQIAVAVLCPVAQVKAEIDELILHGGAVHFSKESINWNGQNIYGLAVEQNKNEFGSLLQGCYIESLSQEHGWLKSTDPGAFQANKPGDLIPIFPVHSCLTANLYDHYITLDGRRIEKRILS